MTKYVVTGGVPLRGKIALHGAKNAGFKAMIAALLTDSPSTLCDLGLISEIDFAKEVISALGATVNSQADPHCLQVDPAGLNSFSVPTEIGIKSRASNLYAPALLARFGQATVPLPGGDQISHRPLERHLDGIKAMGATVKTLDNQLVFTSPNGLHGASYRFVKNTHTGTEFLIMAAVKADGQTILENAAAEPEVDDLIKFLNLMGAQITRVAPRTVKIVGVKSLHGAAHTIMKDRNEAVTFACSAIATRGKVQINGADAKVLEAFLKTVEEAGAQYLISSGEVSFSGSGKLRATDVVAAPYPAFMTDWQPLWATLMTQAEGTSTIHETVHEKRFEFAAYLVKMGAKIEFFEPKLANPDEVYNFNLADDSPENKHAIRISGPTLLTGTEIEVSDVRSGATALMAGVVAKGTTTVSDPKDQIKRGYEDLAGGLVSLGAKIKIEA